MKLFESKLLNRIALGKTIGLVGGLMGVIFMPMVFIGVDTMLIIALLLWYITLGSIIGVFGVWTKHPLLPFKISYLSRGILVGAWMNFLLALFMYDTLSSLMVGSIIEGWSPFWIVVEGAMFGLVVDFITTKYIGEGKKLMK